jgi:6-pyruvoyltetrahydropterin/6-carboxytetrahydropterin synthase
MTTKYPFTISKDFTFSAAHQLHGLSEDHPCSRMHGHNYTVCVGISATHVDDIGFVIDYRELGVIKEYIDGQLDHRILNEVFTFNPTAENMAKFFYDIVMNGDVGERLGEKYDGLADFAVEVSVSETEKTWATYKED